MRISLISNVPSRKKCDNWIKGGKWTEKAISPGSISSMARMLTVTILLKRLYFGRKLTVSSSVVFRGRPQLLRL